MDVNDNSILDDYRIDLHSKLQSVIDIDAANITAAIMHSIDEVPPFIIDLLEEAIGDGRGKALQKAIDKNIEDIQLTGGDVGIDDATAFLTMVLDEIGYDVPSHDPALEPEAA
jgi:hypothetical protein